jgi:hypothetical protein
MSNVEDHAQMVEDCEKRESRMDEWEQGFISDLSDWLGKGKSLTDSQAATLDHIWDKVTEGG